MTLKQLCAIIYKDKYALNNIPIYAECRNGGNETYMKIRIFSRQAVEELIATDFPENTAVISFYDPPSKRTHADYAPVDYQNKCAKLFQVGVHDIDLEILGDYGLTFDTYLPEAEKLAAFIIDSIKKGHDIICQCEHGQSRSAACAAAILEFMSRSGIKVFADYRYYPNQLIFNKIYKALKQEAKRRKEADKNEDNQT